MPKNRVAATPPDELRSAGEPNRYLAKFKTSLGKRWSFARMETLYEIADLAVFLWALGREAEATAVAASVATSVPSPPPLRGGFNYNVWCPATFSHALVARLATDGGRAEVSRAALLRDPGVSRDNPGHVAGHVADARRLAAAPAGQDTAKRECQGLARSLGSVVLYSELAKAGDPLFTGHAGEIAGLIPQLLAKLRAVLETAA